MDIEPFYPDLNDPHLSPRRRLELEKELRSKRRKALRHKKKQDRRKKRKGK